MSRTSRLPVTWMSNRLLSTGRHAAIPEHAASRTKTARLVIANFIASIQSLRPPHNGEGGRRRQAGTAYSEGLGAALRIAGRLDRARSCRRLRSRCPDRRPELLEQLRRDAGLGRLEAV